MRETLSLIAFVKDATAQLSADQRERMARFIANREGKYVQITLRTQGKPRSLNQNAYYWSVCVQMIAEETGHLPEEIHEFLKMKLLPRQSVSIGGDLFSITKSTASLSTDEFEDYLEHVRAFAANELSMTIPLPNEASL